MQCFYIYPDIFTLTKYYLSIIITYPRAGGGLGRQAGEVEAAEALGRHVELYEGREDGVVLDVKILRRGHRHQRLHPRQRHEPAHTLLVSRGSLIQTVSLDIIVFSLHFSSV